MNQFKKMVLAIVLASCSVMSFADNNTAQVVNDPKNFRIEAEKAYLEHRYTDAFHWYERYSNLGDGQSSYNVAYMLQHGQGTKQDYKKALKYYQKASKLNFSMAHMALAEIYLLGEMGVKADLQQAKHYLEKAYKQGYAPAGIELANISLNENTEASVKQGLEILQTLSDANNFDAMYLKSVYDLGLGIRTANQQSITQAIRTLEHLTKQGHIQSMMVVAYMLAYGEVVPQNLPMAHNIYSILVQNNVPTAKERLAEVEKMMQQR